MEHTQKMVVTPISAEMPPSLPLATDVNTQFVSIKKPKSHPFAEKLVKQTKIVLKLGKIDSYDNDLHIKDLNGHIIQNSNIINLLNEALAINKVLIGYDDFVKLLHKANVEPDLITNENIKSKLIGLYNSIPSTPKDMQVTDPYNAVPVIRSIKRTREEEESDDLIEPPSKKVPNWIVPGVEDLQLPDDNDE